MDITPREQLINTLERKPPVGRVPHFELVFFLTMEVFGRVHPEHRNYRQWFQMSVRERELQLADIADIYIMTAEKYQHNAILIGPIPGDINDSKRFLEIMREKSGNKFFLMMLGDYTMPIPDGNNMYDLVYRLADEPEKVKEENAESIKRGLGIAQEYAKQGLLDGFALCSDYCFNTNPFLSPDQFSEFVAPYLYDLIKGYRDMGFYCIKHTDGNIMPILDQLVQCNPHALHSLDPQGGVDIAEVKRLYGDKLCLMGNVNCGLLQNGTPEEIIASARYALQNGMPGGGYIFSTSNCVYTGMPLESYELIHKIWLEEGIYQ